MISRISWLTISYGNHPIVFGGDWSAKRGKISLKRHREPGATRKWNVHWKILLNILALYEQRLLTVLSVSPRKVNFLRMKNSWSIKNFFQRFQLKIIKNSWFILNLPKITVDSKFIIFKQRQFWKSTHF